MHSLNLNVFGPSSENHQKSYSVVSSSVAYSEEHTTDCIRSAFETAHFQILVSSFPPMKVALFSCYSCARATSLLALFSFHIQTVWSSKMELAIVVNEHQSLLVLSPRCD